MKKILLIINNDKTRQVYHRALLSRGIEITPTSDLFSAILSLSLNKFNLIVLDATPNFIETEIFLKIRRKHKYIYKTKFIILVNDDQFKPKADKKDLLIHTSNRSIKDITDQIINAM